MKRKQQPIYKALAAMLAVVMVFTVVFVVMNPAVFAASTVKIGQATNDENGNTRGGKAGDQTGGEVSVSSWSYSSKTGAYNNWKYVIRAKNPTIAAALADAMKKACANNHIGYDQSGNDRSTFYDEAKKVNWDISAITTDCETTCAGVVAVCLNVVGVKAPRYWDSSLVYSFFRDRNDFTILTDSKYRTKSDYLEAGDILLSPGKHTAMVVQSPNSPGSDKTYASISATNTSTATSPFKTGKEYQLLSEMNVRTGAGTNYDIKSYSDLTDSAKKYATSKEKAVLNKGTVVTCIKVSGNWIQIPSGWVCGKSGNTYNIEEFKGTDVQKKAEANALVEKSQTTKTQVEPTTQTTQKKVNVKVGKEYKLKKALYIRTGAGTKYSIIKRSKLSASTKKYAKSGSKAMLKKGTVVTCMKVSKNGLWMKIPSGWICCKPGNVAAK